VCCFKTLPSNCRTELLQFVNGDSNGTSVVLDSRKAPSEPNTSKASCASNVAHDGLCDTSEIDICKSNHSVLSYFDNQTPSADNNSNSTTWQLRLYNTTVECAEGAQ